MLVWLLASWLVAVILIPMLSARLTTPPAVQKSGGLIHKMQVRYARVLRWTLEHRGKSLLGIALIVAVSFVPVMHTKTNMFGGDGGDEINVYYQWKGSYTVAQMSDEVRRVEVFLDANREKFHIQRSEEHKSELQSLMRHSYAVFR